MIIKDTFTDFEFKKEKKKKKKAFLPLMGRKHYILFDP
jgi:hypothetical protein